MGRVGVLSRLIVPLLTVTAGLAPALAQPLATEQRIAHPDGVSIVLHSVDATPDSIILRATIANPTQREIGLDRAQSFVLEDEAHDVHHLNAPLDNPQLRVGPHAQIDAELVFIGPLSQAARQLTLSTNQGIGTARNPYDDAPALRATLPLGNWTASKGGFQATHPDGVTLTVSRLAAGSAGCVASLRATNGNERTVVLNENKSLILSNDGGVFAPVAPPAGNAELVVPSGSRLDAELVFDCRALATAHELTLSTNRGTAGTTDNPYETLPVFALRLPVEHLAAGVDLAQRSRASVSPIARSILTASTAAPVAARPGAAVAAAPTASPPAATGTSTESAPAPQVALAIAATAAASRSSQPLASQKPKTAPQLEAALHASRGYHGLEIVLPADALFGASRDTLEATAQPTLAELAELIAATHPRQIIVAGHTDSNGKDDDNLALSKARAQAVLAWLEAHAAKRRPHFVAEGYGRTRPAAPNHKADGSDNPEGRAQNRRIEITLRR